MGKRFSIEAVFKAVDKLTAPVTRMQNRMGKFTRSLQRGAMAATKATLNLSKSIARGATVAVAGLSVAATGLFMSMNKVTGEVDALAKQSRRLDIPIEELQEMRFVASQAGVDTNLLNSSLGAFSKRLGEAKAGQGPLVSGLKKAHPELLKQLVATESVSEAFDLMVNSMRDAETATDKALIANAAFSRSGLAMVDISKLSASEINALREEQRENGVVTMEQAESAEAYNDAVDSLQRSLKGLMQGVLIPLAPIMTEMVKNTRQWVIENRELVSGKVLNFLNNFDKVMSAIASTVTGFKFIKDVILVPFFKLLVLTGETLGTTAGMIVVAWGDMSRFFKKMWGDVVAVFDSALERITEVVDKVLAVRDRIVDIMQSVGTGVAEFFGFDDAPETNSRGMQSSRERSQITSTNNTTTTERSEVVIRDETGRATQTNPPGGRNRVQLQTSGAF